MKYYKVRADYLYGDNKEEERQKQIDTVNKLGLTEIDENYVVANAEQVIQLIVDGYVSSYLAKHFAEKVVSVLEIQETIDIADIVARTAQKVMTLQTNTFNERCQQHQPGLALVSITETMLLEDSCTDNLQRYLSEGWRIVAVQPQPDQRRPDYILGRIPGYDVPTSARRG